MQIQAANDYIKILNQKNCFQASFMVKQIEHLASQWDAQDKLKGLLEHGIRHIINLMESAPETDQQIELVCSWRPGG